VGSARASTPYPTAAELRRVTLSVCGPQRPDDIFRHCWSVIDLAIVFAPDCALVEGLDGSNGGYTIHELLAEQIRRDALTNSFPPLFLRVFGSASARFRVGPASQCIKN
ncbi:hypothetical protein JYU34_014761, partial [Plutella xylostella]